MITNTSGQKNTSNWLTEPTTGFDPSARRQSWDLIAGLRELGTTIVLTTHYMEEAEVLADRVAVIVQGTIVAEGRPDQLVAAGGETVITFRVAPGTELEGLPVPGVDRIGEEVVCRTTEPTRTLHAITGWALDHDVELVDLEATRPSLEDVYLDLAEGTDS